LKNDYKELMDRIEKGLHQHHAALQDPEDTKEVPSPSVQRNADDSMQISSSLDPPFAKVNSVEPSSPAHEAGLKVGDKIRNFGPVHCRNHENLRKVAEVVQRNEGVHNL
jgi:26S proteasome regulatory subunit N4